MSQPSTESVLKEWRFGSTQAERLCADLLHLEGFGSVDPQHPLGGPDNRKDIVCLREGQRWTAAVYFPPTEPKFKDIKEKFQHDANGAAGINACGMAFFVNQHLTLGERDELLTASGPLKAEIYHLERMRGLLDAPKGCGIRLQYLHIAMTEEEQWAFWSAMNYEVVHKLLDTERRFSSIDRKLDLVLARTTELLGNRPITPSSMVRAENYDSVEAPMSTLSVGAICWIHRILTEGEHLPETSRGRLRSVQVVIANHGNLDEVKHLPPAPANVVPLINDYVGWWTSRYPSLVGTDRSVVIRALAELHHRFLCIHPFLDANGRVARVLLDQAARELLNMRIGTELVADTGAYYKSLMAADQGDLKPLARLIAATLQ